MLRPVVRSVVLLCVALPSAWAALIAKPGIDSSAAAVPTFNQDVAPIFYANCVECHRPGQSAPMSLLTFEEAKVFARRIKEKTTTGMMPPWYADRRFGEFKNARGLTKTQIDTITAWIDGGTPQGEGAVPAPPTLPDGWSVSMGRPPNEVLELPFGQFELPPQGEVPTFTVWLKLPLNDDKFVQAIEVRPSIPNVVHHSSLALATLPQGTKIGRAPVFQGGPALDGVPVQSDGRPFAAKSGEEFGRPIMFYVPGGGFLQFRDGLAKRFREQDYLAWGLHLISRGQVERLRVQIGLWYARRDPHHEVQTWTVNEKLVVEGKELVADPAGLRKIPNIPARAGNWAVTGILPIKEDITIHSLWPHMHYRGKDMTFVLAHPNGTQETLLSVPHYNPHWQITYELSKPLKVKKGSTITAYGHYDNSSANPHNPDPNVGVIFGPQGTDEMFIPFLEVSVDEHDLRFERIQKQIR